MSSFPTICRVFGKIVCTPCLIVYWCITGADKEEEEVHLIPEAQVTEEEPVNIDYGTKRKEPAFVKEEPVKIQLEPSDPPTKADRSTMLCVVHIFSLKILL